MKELVGSCTRCGKDVFCLEGFLTGFKDTEGNLICFDCDEDHLSSCLLNTSLYLFAL